MQRKCIVGEVVVLHDAGAVPVPLREGQPPPRHRLADAVAVPGHADGSGVLLRVAAAEEIIPRGAALAHTEGDEGSVILSVVVEQVLVVIGFFQPVACDMKGFDLAKHLIDVGEAKYIIAAIGLNLYLFKTGHIQPEITFGSNLMKNNISVDLGKSRLRTETAGLSAVMMMQLAKQC